MNVVIDASAIIAVALEETDIALIEATRRTLRDDDQVAPTLMPVEVAGAIAMAEWTGRRSSDDTEAAWKLADEIIGATKLQETSNVGELLSLCRRLRLRAADASYLKLSIDRGASLLTSDKALASAARAAGVSLVYDPQA